MTTFEEKLNAYDPNWRERVYNDLGIIVSFDDNDLEFFSPCCSEWSCHFSDIEIDEDSIDSINTLIAEIRASDGYKNVLLDMNLGSFTKYQLYINLVINFLIPTVKASHMKFGAKSEHISFYNIEFFSPHEFFDNKSAIIVISFAFVERDQSYIVIELPVAMSLLETLEYIKNDIDDGIKDCDINVVTELADNAVVIPQSYNEMMDFLRLDSKWSLCWGDELPE